MAWSSFANWFNLSHNALKNFRNSAKYFRNGKILLKRYVFYPQKTTFFRTQNILKLSGNPVIQSSISLGWYPTLQSYIKLSHCLSIFTTQSQHSHHPQYQFKKQRLNSNRVLVVRNLSLNQQQSHQVVLNYMKFLQLGTLLKRLTSGLKSFCCCFTFLGPPRKKSEPLLGLEVIPVIFFFLAWMGL